jgi:tetratricopeptide (TPR) repeat protein
MNPESAVVHYNRALELERQGRYDDAVKAYQEALRLDANDADAHVRMGLLLRELGRDEEANKAFQAALSLRAARSPGPPGPLWKPDTAWTDSIT